MKKLLDYLEVLSIKYRYKHLYEAELLDLGIDEVVNKEDIKIITKIILEENIKLSHLGMLADLITPYSYWDSIEEYSKESNVINLRSIVALDILEMLIYASAGDEYERCAQLYVDATEQKDAYTMTDEEYNEYLKKQDNYEITEDEISELKEYLF
ncbi:MAG: hypothetical protein ACRC41_14585 [Sarcina sp.]